MFLGIDLGTSNSAIVGSERQTLRLFKTSEGMDVMPSAIMIDRRGGLFVGRKAYDQSAFSPQSVQQKFKRLMGTGSVVEFAGSDRSLTPEEASAEVIKALVAQVHRDVPDVTIEATVITIPAAFNQMQSEATMKAARLAGLDRVALLQEPIAAALAANAETKNGSGQYLIYDLGGGTFDAAIVQSISGNVTVVAHAGVNMLGGADFDRAIVNSMVRPWLLENFKLPANFQTEPQYARLIRIAHYRAELAKIALSTQMSDQVFADESQVGTRDADGNEIYLDVEITRADLENLIADNVERSIAECRTLLSSNGYDSGDMDRVVLIGGPSRMPYVRERVAFELGIALDTKVDPMTAVANGAAIYASGRSWAAFGAAGALSSRQTKRTTSDLQLTFEYADNTAASEIRLRIRAGVPVPPGTTVQVDATNGWTSGKLALTATTDVKGVPLPRVGHNDVKVLVFGADGMPDQQASTTLTVSRLTATADGMPLMHDLAIKIVDGAPGAERNTLKTFVTKGTTTPASGMESYRAARDLRSGDRGSLVFELFEQAEGVDDPSLSLAIGVFELSGSSLTPGQMVRKGDTVNVHWSVDANSLLHCHFELPDVGLFHSLDNVYVPSSTNFDGADGVVLARQSIDRARADVEALERALGPRIAAETQGIREKLDEQQRGLALSNDADSSRMVTQETRFLRQQMHRLKRDPVNAAAVQQAELDEFASHYAQYFAREVEAATNTSITRQLSSSRDALLRNELRESREALDEARALLQTFMLQQPGFWLVQFDRLISERHNAVDKDLHDSLAVRGQTAIDQNDIDGLRTAVFEMMQNMVRGADETDTAILSGLMV
ncbi:Hsp70 family protein [Paradevosia shaoguanensis]|uniref:Hsp70 family protein n=1 Tax=Paradevosia shaoguanensis TaxID=1335043 RepID=A0AA41UA14_9HYPH|nr:Hsp70 family protein [Paradevosia shaoguanensis]MCF1741467.1 Hsp70 family protein [Paradevosia shaoguanensis]MCI0125950.1 Hsp70 family protein [Paradevosia shaoguanensis]